MLRVLVLHRVRLYRDALAAMLARDPLIGEVRTSPTLPRGGGPGPAPDLVLLDVEARGGRERVRAASDDFEHFTRCR